MAIDVLQEKIRKTKNPSVVELGLAVSELPPHILQESPSKAAAYGRFCRELMAGLKGKIPAVRLSFSAFALLGSEGMSELTETLKAAQSLGYYTILEAPEILSTGAAKRTAEAVFGEGSAFPCDGLLVTGYLGSDIWQPFLPYTKKEKDLFVISRTANKSAPELQDLLSGSRLVHMACADHVNRYGGREGKCGYFSVGVLAAASAAQSLRVLRAKYPKLFLLLDGFDYPNANAKNCSYAFDQFGHGAAACAGTSITCAWKEAGSDGTDFVDKALEAAEGMRKKIIRYITVL